MTRTTVCVCRTKCRTRKYLIVRCTWWWVPAPGSAFDMYKCMGKMQCEANIVDVSRCHSFVASQCVANGNLAIYQQPPSSTGHSKLVKGMAVHTIFQHLCKMFPFSLTLALFWWSSVACFSRCCSGGDAKKTERMDAWMNGKKRKEKNEKKHCFDIRSYYLCLPSLSLSHSFSLSLSRWLISSSTFHLIS